MAANTTASSCGLEKSSASRTRIPSSASTTSTTSAPSNMNKTAEKSQHIQVAVRVRPLNESERKQGTANIVSVNNGKREIIVREKINAHTEKKFTYDKVFGPNSAQIEVYREVVLPILDEVLLGYNCTIFAYGQTGTGKTFTMEGERSRPETSSSLVTWESDPLAGVIPRTLHQLFETLTSQQADFTIRVSFIELYNEELFDLLAPDNAPSLRLFDDPVRKGSVVMQGLEEVIVRTKDEVYEILERGANKRATAATLLNAHSSRSHSVFSITVHIRETACDGEEMLKTGKLYLVDLAGSENIGRSGAVDKRAREAGNINQSLLTLGRVITALVEHARHIPYRESKLTRLLQDSLGGRTKTSIIATISPSSSCGEETLSTLEYASRAKNITNKPEINQKVTKKALLKEYAEEIERLRRDLQAARDKHGIFLAKENYDGMVQTLTAQEEHIKELEEQLTVLNQESGKALALFAKTQEELDAAKAKLERTVRKLERARKTLVETKANYLEAATARDETQFMLDEHKQKADVLHAQAQELVSVNEKAVQSIQMLHGKLDRTKTVQETNERQLGEFRNKVLAHVEEMKENLSSFCSVEQELGAEQSHQIKTLVDTAMRHCAETKDSLTKLNESVEKRMQTVAQSTMQFLTQMLAQVTAHMTAQIEEAKAEFQSEAIAIITKLDDVYQSVESGAQAIVATQQKANKLLSSHEDEETERLDNLEAMTDELVHRQFTRDTPTGNTPSRQTTQYRVLRDLARASPHERLVHRFREQYVPPTLSADNSIFEDTLHEDALLDGIDNGEESGRDSGAASLHNGSGDTDYHIGREEGANGEEVKKINGCPIGKGADGSRRRRRN